MHASKIDRRKGALAFAAALLSGLALPAGADVVTLSGARTLRVVAVTSRGATTDLELLRGGIVTVPTATIESIEIEELLPEICSASPYRCQDRGMLLSRRARTLAAIPPTPAEPASKSAS